MAADSAEYKYSEAPLAIRLASSAIAAWTIAVVTVATLGLLASTPGPAALRILGATWIACAGLEAMHRLALRRGARAARSVVLDRSGAIAIEDACGESRRGTLRDGSFVAPWLTIVHWRPEGARFDRTLLVLPDMIAPEDFRRLRVLLRWS